jgi:Leucine-rich repeat (LRR) protein
VPHFGVAIKSAKQLEDGTWAVDLSKSDLRDLAPLKGAPKVADLSLLKGLPIERLYLSRTQVTDLSALRGMPLNYLTLRFSAGITDLSPLSEAASLSTLILPPDAKNIEVLRALPKLKRLGFTDSAGTDGLPAQPAAEFWKGYDAKKK